MAVVAVASSSSSSSSSSFLSSIESEELNDTVGDVIFLRLRRHHDDGDDVRERGLVVGVWVVAVVAAVS